MASLLGEIKRRKVFQIAAAYLVVSWLLVQVITAIEEPLTLPGWSDTLVIVLLAIGFPIAVIIAWAHDSIPVNENRGVEAASQRTVPYASGTRFNYFLLGLIVPTVAFLVVDRFVFEGRSEGSVAGAVSAEMAGTPRTVRRYTINIGPTQPLGNTYLSAHLALSPQGRYLAYAAQIDTQAQLYLRALDQFETRPIPETAGAFHPFFSPDGRWIGFYTDQTGENLERVAVGGGSPQVLASAQFSAGGSWVLDDMIIFGTNHPTLGRALFRVPATGGARQLLVSPEPGSGHVTPAVLPGGEAVLFVIRPGSVGAGNARDGDIALLSLETGAFRTLIERAFRPQYVPTGHIAFVRDAGLWAVPFDVESLGITGPESRVLDGVQQDGFTGGAAYAFSDDGLLVYVPGGDTGAGSESNVRFMWVDSDGNEEPLDMPVGRYSDPAISPQGDRIAYAVHEGGNYDIWVYDLIRQIPSRLTFDPSVDVYPVWTPDGANVVFSSTRSEGGVFMKAADGTGQPRQLTRGRNRHTPEAFSPDGSLLIFAAEGQRWDLFAVEMDDGDATEPLIATEGDDREAAISPDGRWIAYDSNQSGDSQVFVRPFPNVEEGRWQISIEAGSRPVWRSDGRAIIYVDDDGNWVEVEVTTDPVFSRGRSHVLFSDYLNDLLPGETFAVAPDGRLLVMTLAEDESPRSPDTELVVVENWFEELERLAPPNAP